ncbi:hypothetical protein [Ferrovibrio terrae]
MSLASSLAENGEDAHQRSDLDEPIRQKVEQTISAQTGKNIGGIANLMV